MSSAEMDPDDMKDQMPFASDDTLKGLEDLKKDAFKKRLKESIQQSKKGKGRIISAAELDEMVGNGITSWRIWE